MLDNLLDFSQYDMFKLKKTYALTIYKVSIHLYVVLGDCCNSGHIVIHHETVLAIVMYHTDIVVVLGVSTYVRIGVKIVKGALCV